MKFQQYPLAMRVLHWTMAVIIICLVILGFLMGNVFTDEPYTRDLFTWHKSFGAVVLILIIVRIATRLSLNQRVPKLSERLGGRELLAANWGIFLYVLMVMVPLSSYFMSSTYPKSSGIALFGIPLPDALPKSDAWAQIFTGAHVVFSYILATLIVGHIAAAIKHRLFDKTSSLN